jgi:hypothetical protein
LRSSDAYYDDVASPSKEIIGTNKTACGGNLMNTIQLFYVGTDQGIWTRWRNPDGSWSEENTLFGMLNGGVVAAQVPGADVVQLFYRGLDNSIHSRWRNPDGSWSGETPIGGTLNGDPIVALVPGTNVLQLFYRGTDNSIYSRYRNPNGNWSDETKIGGTLNGDPIAARVPGTDILQLFYRGTDNSIYSRWRNPNGVWSDETHIGGTLNGTDVLQLFYRGTDNSLYSRWRMQDGSWSSETQIGGTLAGDPIAVQVPGTNILQLFYRGTDNSLYSRWRNPNGSWSSETQIGGTLNGDPIAAVVPGIDTLQLFYRGTDNGIHSIWRDPEGNWSDETNIGGALIAGPIAVEVVIPVASYTIVLMLWGPPQVPNQTQWLTSVTGKDLGNALTTVAGSAYFDALGQYNAGQVTVASADPPQLSQPPVPLGNSQFSTLFDMNTDIANVVTTSFSNGIPSPDQFTDSIPIYVVITPRGGHSTDAPTSNGEHGTSTWGPSKMIFIYAYANVLEDLNNTVGIVTHEIVEAIGKNGGAPKELCDDCEHKYGRGVPAGINGYTPASYFDAKGNQCVAPPGFAQPA